MLPNHDELVRAMAERTSRDAEHAARDRGFRHDVRESLRAAARPIQAQRQAEPDCRPCPPTASERASGLVG
jgi:hypothetical protein